MKSTSQNHPKRKENIPNLEALTAEIKKLHLAESVFEEESAEVADTVENDVGSSHDAGSFHNTSSFSAMPPPPPPPPLPSSFNGNGVTVSHNG